MLCLVDCPAEVHFITICALRNSKIFEVGEGGGSSPLNFVPVNNKVPDNEMLAKQNKVFVSATAITRLQSKNKNQIKTFIYGSMINLKTWKLSSSSPLACNDFLLSLLVSMAYAQINSTKWKSFTS